MKMAFQKKPTLRSKIGSSHEYKFFPIVILGVSKVFGYLTTISYIGHTWLQAYAYIINTTCDKKKVIKMKLHMLMLRNAWMMLVLMRYKCQMQCLTLGCYSSDARQSHPALGFWAELVAAGLFLFLKQFSNLVSKANL